MAASSSGAAASRDDIDGGFHNPCHRIRDARQGRSAGGVDSDGAGSKGDFAVASSVEELDTPMVLVDQPTVERNLSRMAQKVREHGMALVPHTKTHKSPRWARRQLDCGSPRVMVSKLGEAAVLLRAGITDQFIGYPLVGARKAAQLTSLMTQGLHPVVAVDSRAGVDLLAECARATGQRIEVLVEVDTGFGRCGLAEDEEVLALARYAVQAGLEYQGITCFGGHITWRDKPDRIAQLVADEGQRLAECAAALAGVGLPPRVVSEGGTVIAGYMDAVTAATEMRPGIYIYNDVGTVAAGAAQWDDCAAVVCTSVVSTPSTDRAVIDAGSKSLASDGTIQRSFGRIRERSDLRISFLSEEHGVVVRENGGPTGLAIGQRLTVIPNHVCTMINLHDSVTLHADGIVMAQLPVAMRGAVR